MKVIKYLLKFAAVLLVVSGLAGCKIIGSDDGTQNGGNNNTPTEDSSGSQNSGGNGTQNGGGNGTQSGGGNGSQNGGDQTDPALGLSSVSMAAEMLIGWNLGNTLDAETETGWGAPVTSQAMIDAVKKAGFKTIRIPVSWSTHVTGSDYKITFEWMNRVKEVVGYAVKNDMYIILNVHHDVYSASEFASKSGYCITTSNAAYQKKSKDYLKSVWTQIATEFADYNGKLVFEVLNEPRETGTDWEWYFSSEHKDKLPGLCNVITDYETVCIDAIRAVPGNENRFIMVPGYAASGSDENMLKGYTMPNDSAKDKLILSTHAYSPFNFAMGNADSVFGSDDDDSLTHLFNYLKQTYVDKGIGVVMGEASASNKGNDSERIKWAKSYFGKAKNAGIPVVLWDNMVYSEDTEFNGEHHGWLNRKTCKWYFSDIINAMMEAVDVSGAQVPQDIPVTLESIGWNESASTVLFSGSTTFDDSEWGIQEIFTASKFSGVKEGSVLKFTISSYAGAEYSKLVVYEGTGWTAYQLAGSSLGGSVSGDSISPGNGTTEIYYVLTDEDANLFKKSGFTLRGFGTVLIKIQLKI